MLSLTPPIAPPPHYRTIKRTVMLYNDNLIW